MVFTSALFNTIVASNDNFANNNPFGNQAMLPITLDNRKPIKNRLESLFNTEGLSLELVKNESYLRMGKITSPTTVEEEAILGTIVREILDNEDAAQVEDPSKDYENKEYLTLEICIDARFSGVKLSKQALLTVSKLATLKFKHRTLEYYWGPTIISQNTMVIRAKDDDAHADDANNVPWTKLGLAKGGGTTVSLHKMSISQAFDHVWMHWHHREVLLLSVSDFFQKGLVFTIKLRPVVVPPYIMSIIKAWAERIKNNRTTTQQGLYLETLFNEAATYDEWCTMSAKLHVYLKLMVLAIYRRFQETVPRHEDEVHTLDEKWWGNVLRGISQKWGVLGDLYSNSMGMTIAENAAVQITEYAFLPGLIVDSERAKKVLEAAKAAPRSAGSFSQQVERAEGGTDGKSGDSDQRCHHCNQVGHKRARCPFLRGLPKDKKGAIKRKQGKKAQAGAKKKQENDAA